MRIYSMTATFGKLEHETLTLQPGLNIIEAPNEWGKSTWCAFLVTMLYGLDTRAKTTKAALADKERFAPWSGAPMSGRIELNWDGRDITIERSTKGRTPLGVFRAYETATGLDIPELTATNCGQLLLGVERSVFTRSAFLRLSDLPVVQDDALRHRLNALVTTGDESGAAEALGQKLRELKNHCRYNRSGLLPQAEAQRDTLEGKLQELEQLTTQSQHLKNRQQELARQISALENHRTALRYAEAQEDARRVQAAADAFADAQSQQEQLAQLCAGLPPRQDAVEAIRQLDRLHQDMVALQSQEQHLPPIPRIPETPAAFAGVHPDAAVAQAEQDRAALAALKEPKKPASGVMTAGIIGCLIGLVLTFIEQPLVGIGLLFAGGIAVVLSVITSRKYKTNLHTLQEKRTAICRRYGCDDSAQWVMDAHRYASQWQSYQQALAQHRTVQATLEHRRESIHAQRESLAGRSRGQWQEIIEHHDALADANRALEQARQHLQALRSMIKVAPAPAFPDSLTYSQTQTAQLLSDAAYEQQTLQHRLGQCLGQMDALGSAETLTRELESVLRRICALEQTNAALEQALSALTAARQELQRRFAPRITKRTQALFAELTGQRYNRLTLGEDLSMQAGAQGEDVLRSHQWRSDGTVDQLYLALRLAVAQELMPHAPLILDDALVRFDDRRLRAALKILRQEATGKQVILFTCQTREKDVLNKL